MQKDLDRINLDHIDITIVGAGVVGLAIAKTLAPSTSSLLLLEKNDHFGEETSARNSEVIHAGIYYPASSLKAKLCLRGKSLLYEYCKKTDIAHHAIGKLIVATNTDELSTLEEIKVKAELNGVTDLQLINKREVQDLEPNVKSVAALISPSTGIVSSHELMLQLLGDTEANGGTFVPQTTVTSVSKHSDGFLVNTQNTNGEIYQFITSVLINSAGLGAQSLAKKIEGINPNIIPKLHYCKGSYFSLPGKSPFNRLIYPVPDHSGAGLGIHATNDLGGQVKFGPNTEYCEQLDYAVSEDSRLLFETAIKRYFPTLDTQKLQPNFSGIRPKLQGPNDSFKDFVIQTESDHSTPGLIQLFGIESPGLTSCLAIGEEIRKRLY